MRTHVEVMTEYDRERDAYAKAQDVETQPQLRERKARCRALHDELNAILTAGAKPCPRCERPPIGQHTGPKGKNEPDRFTVGCFYCSTRTDRVESTGISIEAAVLLWNAGIYNPGKEG